MNGQALHDVLEKAASDPVLSEETLRRVMLDACRYLVRNGEAMETERFAPPRPRRKGSR